MSKTGVRSTTSRTVSRRLAGECMDEHCVFSQNASTTAFWVSARAFCDTELSPLPSSDGRAGEVQQLEDFATKTEELGFVALTRTVQFDGDDAVDAAGAR